MSEILHSVDNAVLTISINRPEKRNAITAPMYRAMANAIATCQEDESIRVVLLQGVGEHFTAGNDLSQFANIGGNDDISDTVAFMEALMQCPVPVVAKVRGMAVGIGTTLLLHCDLVYCSQDTVFSLPFINLGLVPEYASSWILPRLVGHRKASEWLMLGDAFSATDALQVGLVNNVCETAALDEVCAKALAKLVAKPGSALRHTKALMKTDQEAVQSHMKEELGVFLQHLKSAPAQEAFSAFLEKRKPNPDIYK